MLDTNIIISACLKPGGLEARTVQLTLKGAFTLCLSHQVWEEYRDVLSRDKFRSIYQRAEDMLAELHRNAFFLEVTQLLQIAKDDDDNRFLECAASANAAYLVTGNLKHFPSCWQGTKIVNAREFLTAEFACELEER